MHSTFLLLTVVLISQPFGVTASCWPFSRSSISDTAAQDSSSMYELEDEWISNLFQFSGEEVTAIKKGQATINKYIGRGETCFASAVESLHHGCSQVQVSESSKTLVAIRMTICELATAGVSPPTECDIAWNSSEEAQQPTETSIRNCVFEFGKVKQFWTSYSGYYREVLTMCFAVRYVLERESLSDLQRNITYSQLQTYRILLKQYDAVKEWRQKTSEDFEGLSELQNSILGVSESVSQKVSLASEKLDSMIANLVSKANDTVNGVVVTGKEAISRMEKMFSVSLAELFSELEGNEKNAKAAFSQFTKDVTNVTNVLSAAQREMTSFEDLITRIHSSASSVELKVTAVDANMKSIVSSSSSQKKVQDSLYKDMKQLYTTHGKLTSDWQSQINSVSSLLKEAASASKKPRQKRITYVGWSQLIV